MSKNFEAFLKMNTSRYANQYVVLVKGRLAASGTDLLAMLKRVKKKYPGTIPFVAKIPQRGLLVLLGV